ncbi:MAG: lysophospholipid acyltransferase family protein [Paracoccaceae bacterium]
MSQTWQGAPYPEEDRISARGWALVLIRGPMLALTVFGGLAVLLLLRLIERPLCGLRRPVTPWITQGVCRAALAILGLGYRVEGRPMRAVGGLVANHVSWLDIFVLNAAKRIYFVAKSEVAGWPGIGWLARATGTVFIARDRRQARAQKEVFEDRLLAGHKLMFFPEGTSTDGRRVLPFKTTLFEAFFSQRLEHEMHMQAISLAYHAPGGSDPRFYGWWGEMGFGPSLLRIMATAPQGRVEVVYHPPVRVDAFADRKALARHLEGQVRAGLLDRDVLE